MNSTRKRTKRNQLNLGEFYIRGWAPSFRPAVNKHNKSVYVMYLAREKYPVAN